MNILLTGGSGFIRQYLLLRLQAADHQIHCCVRQLPSFPLPNVTYIKTDFAHKTQIQDWQPHLNDIDIVINTVGIIQEKGQISFDVVHNLAAPCVLFSACQQANVKQVIQISALGADTTAITPFLSRKKTADDFLSNLDINSINVMLDF